MFFVQEYLQLFDDLQEAREYRRYIEDHKEEYGRYWEEDIREQDERIKELKSRIAGFFSQDKDLDTELEKIRCWLKEKKALLGSEQEN